MTQKLDYKREYLKLRKNKLISLTKAITLLGLYGSLFIPLSPLMEIGDSFFSLATALILIYAFYTFDKGEENVNK